MIKIILKSNREKPVRQGSPWIFSGAIQRVEAGRDSVPGETCEVFSAQGEKLATGYYNGKSSIAVRILSFGSAGFAVKDLYDRMLKAKELRDRRFGGETDTYRVINSEGDFLPGLIVDRYASGLCIQVLTAGMDKMRVAIVENAKKLFAPSFIADRSDEDMMDKEGIGTAGGVVEGNVPNPMVVSENGIKFRVDITGGQKTGLYLDQRESRRLAGMYARGASVADCFCYTGGFSLYCLKGGAESVHSIDTSGAALELARENRKLNGFNAAEDDFIEKDIFKFLREAGGSYDMIILDPPKFAKHATDVQTAARGYKDINLQAMKKIVPGGILFTFSCSHAVDAKLFRQIVFGAAADSGRSVQVLHVLGHPPDHPVNLAHREGEYLKGLVVRVQ